MAGSALAPVPCWSVPCWSPQRLTLPPKQRFDYQVEVGGEIRLACGRTPRIGAYHQQATFRKRPQVPAGQMAQLAAHPVAGDCVAHGATHHEADPGRIIVIGADKQVSRQRRPASPAAFSDGLGELRAPPHPGGGRQHRCSPLAAGADAGQTLTRARPLRRRAARTARPARVRMRSRNPCVLARRRLFGWNVRLLTGDSRYGCTDKAATPVPQHAEVAPGVAGPENATRPGGCRSNQRPETGSCRARLGPVTAGDTCCLPNERRTRALGCG